MIDLLALPAFASRSGIHVVVETPRHAQAKFKYEPELGVFMLSRALTLGLSYPYAWGFVPSTTAPDGDPIDALVLHGRAGAAWFPADRDSDRVLQHPAANVRAGASGRAGGHRDFRGAADRAGGAPSH